MAMDSVLGQSYPNLELLVMDDGSTDGTPELLEEYSRNHPPERFRFSRHENMGQARTLNRGYEMARGEILGYLSDDDLLARGAVARLIAELREHPDAVAVYPGYRMIDTDGEIVDTVRPIEYSPVEAFRLHDTIIGPGGLVRREVLEATGGWEEDWHWMGDLILWMRVGLAGSVIRVEHPVASWRRHPGGITIETSLERARQHLQLRRRRRRAPRSPRRRGRAPGGGAAQRVRDRCLLRRWARDRRRAAVHGDRPPAPRDLLVRVRARVRRPPGRARRRGRDGCGGSWLRWSSRSSIGGPIRNGKRRPPAQDWTPRCGACGMSARSRARTGPSPTPPTARCSRPCGRRRTTACRTSTSSTTRYLLVDRRREALTEDELGQLTIDAFHASIPRLRNAIAAFRRELGSAPDRAPG